MLPCPDGTACRAPVVTLMWHSCQPQCNTFAMCSWIGCNFCTEAYSHLCVSVLCTLNAWEISSAVAVLLIPKTWARKPWNFASSCIILRFYFFFAWKILDILAAGLNSLLRRASRWPRHVGQNLLQQPMQLEIFPCSGCSSCNIRWCFLSNSRLRCSWSSCSFDITSYSEVPPTQQTEIASLVVGPQLFLQQKPVSPPKRNVKLVQPQGHLGPGWLSVTEAVALQASPCAWLNLQNACDVDILGSDFPLWKETHEAALSPNEACVLLIFPRPRHCLLINLILWVAQSQRPQWLKHPAGLETYPGFPFLCSQLSNRNVAFYKRLCLRFKFQVILWNRLSFYGETDFQTVCPFRLASSYILAAKSDFPLSLWFQNQRPRHVIDLRSEIETTLYHTSRRFQTRVKFPARNGANIYKQIDTPTNRNASHLSPTLPPQLIRRHTPLMIDVAMYMQVSPREVPYKTPLHPPQTNSIRRAKHQPCVQVQGTLPSKTQKTSQNVGSVFHL